MKHSRSNRWFWVSIGTGALVVAVQSATIFGPAGALMGIGSGASLGAVIYYLGEMAVSATRWVCQQLKRP